MESPVGHIPAEDIVWPPLKPAMTDFAPVGKRLTLCAAGFFGYVEIFERWLANHNQLLPAEQQIFTETEDAKADGDDSAYWRWYQYSATYMDTIHALKSVRTRFGDAESFYSSWRLELFQENVWYMLDGHVHFYKAVQEALDESEHDSDEIRDLRLRGQVLLEQAQAHLANTPLPKEHSWSEWCSRTKSYNDMGGLDEDDGGNDGSEEPPPTPGPPRVELAVVF